MSDVAAAAGSETRFSRRAALGAGAALALAASSATARPLSLDSAEDERLIYRKLRYRTDDGLVFWWIKGVYMAAIEAELTPMYGINLGAIQRVTHRPDGGFDVRDLEISFRTDPQTGKRLDQFHNPISGQTIPVVVNPPRPYLSSFDRDNVLAAPGTVEGARFEVSHYPGRPFSSGNSVYLRERSRARVTAPGQPTRVLNEISTFIGDKRETLDPKVTSVRAKSISNDVRGWPAWVKMDDRPGMMSLFGVGEKVSSFDELPNDWRAMLRETLPDVARNPLAALDLPPL